MPPTTALACPQAPFNSAHPCTPAQPASRASSWGSRRGAVAWPRPGSSAYPVLSLQSLLTTALGTGLAPGCSRPGRGRGRPVLWGRRWSRLFPLGVLKQMLHAPRLRQQLACLHLWAPGEGPQGHLCSVSPSSRQRQCQALLGSPFAAGKTVLGEPQASETQQWTPVGYLGPPAPAATCLPMDPQAGAAAAPRFPRGQPLSPEGLPSWFHSRHVPSSGAPRLLRTQVACAAKAQNRATARD